MVFKILRYGITRILKKIIMLFFVIITSNPVLEYKQTFMILYDLESFSNKFNTNKNVLEFNGLILYINLFMRNHKKIMF